MSYIIDNGYTKSKHTGQLRDLSSQLILHGKLIITKSKAKDVQKYIEPLVTLAKRGDLHARREAIGRLRDNIKKQDKDVIIKTLFTVIAERYKERNGGYTKIINLDLRPGDNAKMVLITFV